MYLLLGSVSAVLLILYLYIVNRAMTSVPEEVRRLSPHRWTEKEIRETYDRIKRSPVDVISQVPPKLERRYVVVGGSGESYSLHSDESNPFVTCNFGTPRL